MCHQYTHRNKSLHITYAYMCNVFWPLLPDHYQSHPLLHSLLHSLFIYEVCCRGGEKLRPVGFRLPRPSPSPGSPIAIMFIPGSAIAPFGIIPVGGAIPNIASRGLVSGFSSTFSSSVLDTARSDAGCVFKPGDVCGDDGVKGGGDSFVLMRGLDCAVCAPNVGSSLGALLICNPGLLSWPRDSLLPPNTFLDDCTTNCLRGFWL
jgi:hypothetical protein